MEPTRDTALNESQQRRLIVSCQYVDRLLADLDRAFIEATSNSPFSRYVNDLAPAEQRLVRDYVVRVRTQLVRMLEGQGLAPTPSRIGLRHSFLTHLTFVDVAIEELKPHYMAGYGTVTPEAETALNGIVEELHGTIRQLTRYLSVDRSEGLRERMERLGGGVADAGLLDALEALIAKYGLVEFRGALATVLDTLERRGLELAVFGRVSTGKSSLLNRLLGHDVLPVGVTPITAVPTRITFGAAPKLRVSFADAPAQDLNISVLPEYASERENPANSKRVLRLIVKLRSPLLESGVTLVDTPGLGSLAASGTAETLAYLPYCDVAAVLVDAASTLTSDDRTVIGLLLNAGIQVSVLLSKADLLSESDRDAALTYTREILAREFDVRVPVVAVSVLPAFDPLFQAWRQTELNPLIANQDAERRKAAARKLELLRSQVESTLRRWSTGNVPAADSVRAARHADTELQTAAAGITALERRIDALTLTLPRQSGDIIHRTADLLGRKIDSHSALSQAYAAVAGEAAKEIGQALQALSAELASALRRVATSVGAVVDLDDTSAREHELRNVPAPSLPTDIVVPLEGAERLLGHGLARAIVVKRLERAVGDVVRSSVDSYAAVLRRWALDNLDAIRIDWTAKTDAIRADIDRRLGHSAATSIDSKEIETDLHRLSDMAGARA